MLLRSSHKAHYVPHFNNRGMRIPGLQEWDEVDGGTSAAN